MSSVCIEVNFAMDDCIKEALGSNWARYNVIHKCLVLVCVISYRNCFMLSTFSVVFMGFIFSHPQFQAGMSAFLYLLLHKPFTSLPFSNAIKYTRPLASYLCNLLWRAVQPVLQESGSSELHVCKWGLTSHSALFIITLISAEQSPILRYNRGIL